jgi:DNA-binding SARP family transcriptional activator/tetratricopeptide (TPR) repeat protein
LTARKRLVKDGRVGSQMLRIRLLGALALEAEGRAIEPPAGRPARALLCWLAVNRGMHARSRVAAALWPDVLDSTARASLRTALTALRAALGGSASAVVATRDRVGLAPEVWVDVAAMDELLAAGRLAEAVELHRGDLVPELDQDWVIEARDERRARLAEALAGLADAAEGRGDLDAAVRHTRELSAIDPLSEGAQRALMRRLAASGDRAAALGSFERFRERVRAELGVAPAAETRELAERLRRGDVERPAAAAGRPPLPPALARRHRSAFVGRARELDRLWGCWRLAERGEQQLVIVSGEPGIGKSRLAAELARAVHARGATVLFGRCSQEPLLPYQPFAEALRPLLAPPVPERLRELERLTPGRGGRTAGAEFGTEVHARFRLFEAVRAALQEAAERRPVALVLEDLHWADEPTLRLLVHLAGSPEAARVLVVASYRETELRWAHALAEALAELRRERVGTRIPLAGLGRGDVAALVARWRRSDVPGAAAGEIHRRTEGNPFFVEELLSHLEESGAALAAAGVPEGVKEVIERRVARLGEGTHAVLAAAAVLGRRFDQHLLERVVEETAPSAVADALDEAGTAGLVRPEPEQAGRHAFSHALVREALYEGLAGARRGRLHARAAAALEDVYGERPERVGEIAHHLFEAAAPALAARGIDYAVRAAALAADQLAHEDAALHLERALRALDVVERPDERRRCELLLALGDARLRSGDRSAARSAFAAAAEVARALGTAELLARAALGHGGLGVTILAVDDETVALLEEALESVAEDGGAAALRARLLSRLAVELYYGPLRERSERLGAEALELARRSGDERALAYALNARHVSLWRSDRLDERLAIAREMTALGRRTGDRESELQARNWLVTDLFEAGEIAELDAAIERYEDLAREARLPGFEWYAPMWRASLAALRGDLSAVEPLLEDAVRIGRRGGDPNVELADQVRLGVHCMRGDFEAAYAHYAPMAAPKIGRSPASLSFLVGAAWFAARTGRETEAREHVDRLAGHGVDRLPFDVNWLESVGILGETCALLGVRDAAARLYELLLPYRGRVEPVAGRALVSWGVADRHLGVLATAIGRLAEAERHFQAALRGNERLGFRPWVAWTRHQYAGMLGERGGPGDAERATALLSAAAELARELSLDGLAELSEPASRHAAR